MKLFSGRTTILSSYVLSKHILSIPIHPASTSRFHGKQWSWVLCRFESINSMEDRGYATMVSYLEASGLKKFLTAGKTVYEESLSEFFENAKVDNDVIVSSVKGVLISITQVMFQEAFSLPGSGLSNILDVSDEAKKRAWKILAGDFPFISSSFDKRDLKMEYRVLCDIVAKHIEYKSGSFDQVTKTTYCYLVAIVAKEEVNWSSILFQILLKFISHPRANKGFGLVLSRLLEKLIVDLEVASTIHPFRILDSRALVLRANNNGHVKGLKIKEAKKGIRDDFIKRYRKKRGEEKIRKTNNKNGNLLKHNSLSNGGDKIRSSSSVESDSDDAPLFTRKSNKRRTLPIDSLEDTFVFTRSPSVTSQLEAPKQTQRVSGAAGSETISVPVVGCNVPIDFCNMNSCTCALVRAQVVQKKLPPKLASCVKLVTRSQQRYLALPKPFCCEYLRDRNHKVLFVCENGKEFTMGYRARSCSFRTGWRSFFIAHRLLEGDALVLHLIDHFKFKEIKHHGALTLALLFLKLYIVRSCRPEKGDHGAVHNPNLDVPIDTEDARIGPAIEEESDVDYFSEDSHQENSTSSLNLDCTPPLDQCVNLRSVASKGIEFSESVVKFQDVKRFEDFKIYQKNDSETSKIADAIKSTSIMTSIHDLECWDKTLKAFEDLGMSVGFLRARIDMLVKLSREYETINEPRRANFAQVEDKKRALGEKVLTMDALLKSIETLKELIKSLEAEIDAVERKNEGLGLEFNEIAAAPW